MTSSVWKRKREKGGRGNTYFMITYISLINLWKKPVPSIISLRASRKQRPYISRDPNVRKPVKHSTRVCRTQTRFHSRTSWMAREEKLWADVVVDSGSLRDAAARLLRPPGSSPWMNSRVARFSSRARTCVRVFWHSSSLSSSPLVLFLSDYSLGRTLLSIPFDAQPDLVCQTIFKR